MNQLKQLRKKRGLTQSDVAEGVGLATTTIAGYEQGRRNISVPIAMQLAKFFGVKWTIFFDDKVREMYDINENNNQASDQTHLV